jgi:TusA-related sulfurtransferase
MQHKLDLRGAIIPFSLLKVIQEFKMMDPGETLEICWSDPETPADLFKVLPHSSYELISMEEMAGEGTSYQLTLVKKQFEKRI